MGGSKHSSTRDSLLTPPSPRQRGARVDGFPQHRWRHECHRVPSRHRRTVRVRAPPVAAAVAPAALRAPTSPRRSLSPSITHPPTLPPRYPTLRESVMRKLLLNFGDMQANNVIGVALWIIGEYSDNVELIEEAFEEVRGVCVCVRVCVCVGRVNEGVCTCV